MFRKGNFVTGTRGVSRTPSKRKQAGDVLFRSTFEGGTFDGWRDHFTGVGTAGQPYGPLSLTRYPTFGGEYALRLTTADMTYASIPDDGIQNSAATYKNLSRYFTKEEAGLISFSGYYAVGGGPVLPAANWSIGIDSQLWDSSDRSFFKFNCRYAGNGEAQWYLTDNSGNPVQLLNNVSKYHTAGINQNKFNFNYVEATVDLSKNGGRGAYHSLQVNDAYFDLTDTGIWADPTQSGRQGIQGQADAASSAQHLLDFKGGLNFGIFASALATDTGPFYLIADELTATIYDAD